MARGLLGILVGLWVGVAPLSFARPGLPVPASCYKEFQRLTPSGPSLPRAIARETAKTLFYPIVTPGRLIGWARTPEAFTAYSLRATFTWKKVARELAYAATYLSLWGLTQTTTVSISSLENAATASLDDDEILVIVNGFEASDPWYDYVRNETKEKIEGGARVVYLQPKNAEELIRALEDISETTGKIGFLKIYGHGAPGAVLMDRPRADEWLSFSSLRAAERRHPDLKGIFSKDATIALFSCNAGNGDEGEELMDTFADTLLDEGGTVVASRINITPNFTDVVGRYYTGQPLQLNDTVNEVVDFFVAPIRLGGELYSIVTAASENDELGSSFEFSLDPIREKRYGAVPIVR